MKRKSTQEAAVEPEFEADDEFLAQDNQTDDWSSANIEPGAAQTSRGPSLAPAPEPAVAASESGLVDPEVGETASDAFKALAAQIISTFGADSSDGEAAAKETASPPVAIELAEPAPAADPFADLPPLTPKTAAAEPEQQGAGDTGRANHRR